MVQSATAPGFATNTDPVVMVVPHVAPSGSMAIDMGVPTSLVVAARAFPVVSNFTGAQYVTPALLTG